MENLTDRVKPLIEEAVNRLFLGWDKDTLKYDISFGWAPHPQGVRPALTFIIMGPSPLLTPGAACSHIHMLDTPYPTQQVIDDMVIACLESLNEQKTAALSLSNGKGSK